MSRCACRSRAPYDSLQWRPGPRASRCGEACRRPRPCPVVRYGTRPGSPPAREKHDERVEFLRLELGAVGGHVSASVQDAPGELVRGEAAAHLCQVRSALSANARDAMTVD